jgi:hypothetical protein
MSIQPAARSSNRLGHPLGTSRDWRRRLLLHHLPLALATGVVLVVFIGLSPFTSGGYPELDASRGGAFPTTRNPSSAPTRIDHGTAPTAGRTPRFQLPSRVSTSRLTVATGYVALGLLALTLLIGPANLLLRRKNPVSSSLRRDAGTWTAIASVVHVVLGLQLHGRGSFSFVDFFVADGRPLTNSFGLGNWTGLAALVIVVGCCGRPPPSHSSSSSSSSRSSSDRRQGSGCGGAGTHAQSPASVSGTQRALPDDRTRGRRHRERVDARLAERRDG